MIDNSIALICDQIKGGLADGPFDPGAEITASARRLLSSSKLKLMTPALGLETADHQLALIDHFRRQMIVQFDE